MNVQTFKNRKMQVKVWKRTPISYQHFINNLSTDLSTRVLNSIFVELIFIKILHLSKIVIFAAL